MAGRPAGAQSFALQPYPEAPFGRGDMLGCVTVRSPDDSEPGCLPPSLPSAVTAWRRCAQRAPSR